MSPCHAGLVVTGDISYAWRRLNTSLARALAENRSCWLDRFNRFSCLARITLKPDA